MNVTSDKPAALGGGSYTQMFLDNPDRHFIDAEKALTYNEVLKWGGRKHSEAMKPYEVEDGYPAMDYLWPIDPKIPSEFLSDRETEYLASNAYRFQCDIWCDSLQTDCNSNDPIDCAYGAITGAGIVGNWSIDKDYAVSFVPTSGSAGTMGGVLIYPPNGDWMGIGVNYSFTVSYQDIGTAESGVYWHPLMEKWITILPGSSVCTHYVFVSCCGSVSELEFDDASTPDTVSYAAPINVYVKGGAGPYTWSVQSGTGYSLTYSETDEVVNILSVVDGTCDTNFDPNCVIKVTDACDQTVTFPVNHADGYWNECRSASGGCTPLDPLTYVYAYYALNTRSWKTRATCGAVTGQFPCGTSYTGVFCSETHTIYGCPGLFGYGVWIWECTP